jgi:hypothetical protein
MEKDHVSYVACNLTSKKRERIKRESERERAKAWVVWFGS